MAFIRAVRHSRVSDTTLVSRVIVRATSDRVRRADELEAQSIKDSARSAIDQAREHLRERASRDRDLIRPVVKAAQDDVSRSATSLESVVLGAIAVARAKVCTPKNADTNRT